MDIRRNVRLLVNILSLLVAILATPSFIALIPTEYLPVIISITAVLNMILSFLRKTEQI